MVYILFVLLLNSFIIQANQDIRLTAESEPLASVADCVNVITGDFFIIDNDLFVDGIDPLHYTRCYDSGHMDESPYGYGFGSQFALGVLEKKDLEKYNYFVEEREGLLLPYESLNLKKETSTKLSEKVVDKGITNFSENGIHAKTNPYSSELTIIKSKGSIKKPILKLADGTKRYYELVTNKKGEKFNPTGSENYYRLIKEEKPNTHALNFEYKENNLLQRITTTNSEGNKIFNYILFDYDKNRFVIYGTNGRSVDYLLNTEKINNQKYSVLTQVIPSNGPWRKYYPCESRKTGSKARFQIIEKPDGRYLKIEYDKEGKVSKLSAPVGESNDSIVTHRFEFEHRKTIVYDALNYSKTYHYSKDRRISKIQYFDHQDKYFWSSKEKSKGWLTAKAYCTLEDSNAISITKFEYDAYGNIIIEKKYGNLTGNSPETIKIDDNCKRLTNSDCYIKYYTYSTDGFNLLLSESDSVGHKTTYTYISNSNLIQSKFVYDSEKIDIKNQEFIEVI